MSIAAGGAGAVVAVVGLAVGARSGGSAEVEGAGAAAVNDGVAVGAAGAVGELVGIRVAAHLPRELVLACSVTLCAGVLLPHAIVGAAQAAREGSRAALAPADSVGVQAGIGVAASASRNVETFSTFYTRDAPSFNSTRSTPLDHALAGTTPSLVRERVTRSKATNPIGEYILFSCIT